MKLLASCMTFKVPKATAEITEGSVVVVTEVVITSLTSLCDGRLGSPMKRGGVWERDSAEGRSAHTGTIVVENTTGSFTNLH